MKITIIRHFPTAGNLKKRYIGRTDEEICKIIEGLDYSYLKASKVFVSPMKRALETADILFPEAEKIIIPGLREMDFGIFENKNYKELTGNKDYRLWLNSYCEDKCPQGESRKEFYQRTVNALIEIKELSMRLGLKEAVIVAHGGTAMVAGEKFGKSGTDYFDTKLNFGESATFEI